MTTSLGCRSLTVSVKYGKQFVTKISQTEIYFYRTVEGLSKDMICLSAKKDICKRLDLKSILCFTTLDPAIFYRLKDDSVAVYYTGSVSTIPVDFPLKVSMIKLSALDVFKYDEFAQKGLIKKVRIVKLTDCALKKH